MNRILGTITTLDQHIVELANGGDAYRPANCPYCQVGGLWHHGCYHRKADRSVAGSEPRANAVAILRFLCNACLRTCSRLPACIAPRRWYDWAMQQIVLLLLLTGGSPPLASSTKCWSSVVMVPKIRFIGWSRLLWVVSLPHTIQRRTGLYLLCAVPGYFRERSRKGSNETGT